MGNNGRNMLRLAYSLNLAGVGLGLVGVVSNALEGDAAFGGVSLAALIINLVLYFDCRDLYVKRYGKDS